MPIVELSETTFRRLQSRAIAFVDSPESVIMRLLDESEPQKAGSAAAGPLVTVSPTPTNGAKLLNAEEPESLRHTKVISGRFGSRHADKWNELLVVAHAEGLSKVRGFEELKSVSISAITRGRREDSGYHYQSSLDLSIQYVDADKAWRQILHLAKRLGSNVEVKFLWREKEGAARPGEYGLLRWGPTRD